VDYIAFNYYKRRWCSGSIQDCRLEVWVRFIHLLMVS
jgi:hypothetical protein